MISLLIDTASDDLILALAKDNQLLNSVVEKSGKTLSSTLLPTVKKLIDDSELEANDIDNIIAINGPGSFTGIRMGVTLAKTYAWSLNKTISTASALELMATTDVDGDFVMPLINARHGAVFAGLYSKEGYPLIEDCYINLEELLSKLPNAKIVAVSNDDFTLPYQLVKPNRDLLKFIKRHQDDPKLNPHLVNPAYLKNTEAEDNLGRKND